MDHRARPAARLTVLTGPPGVGVENLVELVRARVPWSWRSVSMTTRPRRRDEIDGVHHFFVGHDEFDRMVAGGHLLEWAQIADDRYGTSRDETLVHLWAGRPVLLPLDERGVEQVRTTMPDVRVVRLVPRAVAPAPVAGHGADTLVVVDSAERAVDKLVGLLGSSFLAPAHQSG